MADHQIKPSAILEPITSFRGRYSFLSNFYPVAFTYKGHRFLSAEHAFQSEKTLNTSWRLRIQSAATPAQAKRLGQQAPLREDWETIKIHRMRQIVFLKFQVPHLKAELLETGTRDIIEGNDWGDHFWGVCRGKGQNWLGKILMEIRADAISDRPSVQPEPFGQPEWDNTDYIHEPFTWLGQPRTEWRSVCPACGSKGFAPKHGTRASGEPFQGCEFCCEEDR